MGGRSFILLSCVCLVLFFATSSSAEGLLGFIRNKLRSKNAVIKNRDGTASDFASSNYDESHPLVDSDLKLPNIANAIHYPIYVPSSASPELSVDGDSSWVSDSNLYTSSASSNSLIPSLIQEPVASDPSLSNDEWASRSSSVAHPFLEVYDEQQLLEQRELLRKRLEAAKGREALRQQAARAHDYTDSVTDDASAYDDRPYKLPRPSMPVPYSDDDPRPEGHSDDVGYLEDNPTSASSSLHARVKSVYKPDTSISALFTSAEALAAANLLNPPPPPRASSSSSSSPSSSSSSSSLLAREFASDGRKKMMQMTYSESKGMSRTSGDQIESEQKTRGLSRRSNRVNLSYGSVVTRNMPRNVPDHPYFSRFLTEKSKQNGPGQKE